MSYIEMSRRSSWSKCARLSIMIVWIYLQKNFRLVAKPFQQTECFLGEGALSPLADRVNISEKRLNVLTL